MIKVALVAAALAAATLAPALAANADPAAPAASPAELDGMASTPASAPDWTPLPPPHGAGLDFKEAATEPVPAPPPDTDGDARHRVIPALLALGALAVLLRKRPT